MNLQTSIGYSRIEHRVLSWWKTKSEDEKLQLETFAAILAPAMGTLMGTALVFALV